MWRLPKSAAKKELIIVLANESSVQVKKDNTENNENKTQEKEEVKQEEEVKLRILQHLLSLMYQPLVDPLLIEQIMQKSMLFIPSFVTKKVRIPSMFGVKVQIATTT